MNDKDFELTKKKFESMYFLAKNGAPLSLFAKYIITRRDMASFFVPHMEIELQEQCSLNLLQKALDIS